MACITPPPYPMPPARGPARHFVVGGGGSNDFAARPTGTVFSADGSFASVSAGITEAGQINGTGSQVNNAYTLQLNTNFFTSTACTGSPNPSCKGWEQFVYINDNVNHSAFIQYWLIQYNTTCPGGWTTFQFTGSTDIYCFKNSPGGASLTAGQPVSNFGNMTLTGAVTTTSDSVTIVASGSAVGAPGSNAVDAAAGWTDAEFNVFGDAGGGEANFGMNSSLEVKTTVHNGTKNAPSCELESFTGETNNLTLVGTAPIPTQQAPSIEFNETNVLPGTAASCAAAAGIGDTHLSTFGGLLYDFQASGDFVLAQTDKSFMVENRQKSGAPNWPNAAVNKAVATQMGDTRVAVCVQPSRLYVDGKTTEMRDGEILSLPGGVDILHTGNVYLVEDQSGNSMRAEDDGLYINVSVGLGHWPQQVRGILTNASGHVNQIEARTGAVLTTPFLFSELYHQYADSWRVPPGESLLSVCGEQEIETGIPKRPFYANNLDPQVYKQARAVCTAAGVKVRPWLDACTLDVAVIGIETAAKVFVGLRTPVAVGTVVTRRDHDHDHDRDHDHDHDRDRDEKHK